MGVNHFSHTVIEALYEDTCKALVILTYYQAGTRTIATLDKKRWQIEPFSRIQKERLEVVDVIVTHDKVVKAHAGMVLISLIHYL